MARQRQGQSGSRSLWARAGERAGDGAGALFARLDAQDALDSQDMEQAQTTQDLPDNQSLERAAATLERLAEQVRAGVWSEEIAALVARAEELSGG